MTHAILKGVAANALHSLSSATEGIRAMCRDPHPRALEAIQQRFLPVIDEELRVLRVLAADDPLPLDFHECDLGEIAIGVLAEASSRPKWQGVSFDAEGDAPCVKVDPALIRLALRELVENAADACSSLDPRQEVVVKLQAIDGHMTLRVSDNGCGIDARQMQSLAIGSLEQLSDREESVLALSAFVV